MSSVYNVLQHPALFYMTCVHSLNCFLPGYLAPMP